MWRRLLIVTGLAAIAAYFLRRRPRAPSPAIEADPAEELRRKLDEVKASEAAQSEADDTEVADLDARRRSVHERARAAVDEMQDSSSE